MNNKRILNGLILTIFLILGAMFVSGDITVNEPGNNTYVSGTLTVNFTISNFVNFTGFNVTISDGTTVTVLQDNNTWNNGTDGTNVQVTLNTTSLSDASTYILNISTNLTSGEDVNANTSFTSLVIDNTAPNSTVAITGTKNGQQDQTLTAGGEIDYGTEVTINCGANDTQSGLNTTRSSISILYPGVANYQNVSSTLVTSANQTLSADLLRTDTDTLGEMRILCTLIDLAGNSLTRYYNLTTITVINQGTSAFAAEGFEAPVGKIKLSSGTVSDAGRLTTDGESRLMKVNSAIKFDMVGEEHKIEVKSASATEVTVIVTSEPQEVTIAAGESESVDVNGDGIADLEMTYHKLFAGSYADLTFALISEAVEVSEEVEEVEEEISETESEEYVEQKGGLTVTLAVIVIILIIGYALIKGKKK